MQTDNLELRTLLKFASSEKNQSIICSLIDHPNGIPVSIFCTDLSPLEAVMKYLVENKRLTVKICSLLLNRSTSSLYTTYTISKKKMPDNFVISTSTANIILAKDILVPYNLFENRDHSILETLVKYLRVEKGLSLREISDTLCKSYSTIKTVSWRHAKKDEE